jgi:4-amino-4-deoxy-L-arabinose transferase-like glycosyltransferase
VVVLHPPDEHVYSDMHGYLTRAADLASGEPLDRYDAFYPPGTHLLLSLPLWVFGTGSGGRHAAVVLWWALSSLTPFFAWRLARQLIAPSAAALAAILLSFYPLHILYAGYFTSETPALALIVASLWLGYRARGAAAGLLGGGAVAARPQYLLNLLILAVPMFRRRPVNRRAAIALVGAAAVVVGAVVAHNSAAADRLTGINENGALTLYQGHCDVRLVTAGAQDRGGSYVFGSPVNIELERGRDVFFPDHQVWDQGFFYGETLDCIGDDGLAHLGVLARNLLDATATTTPWPLGEEEVPEAIARATNALYSVLLPAIVVLAVLLIHRRRRAGASAFGETALLLHLLCLVPVTTLISTEPRYRVPYDLFGLILLSAILLARPWRTSSQAEAGGG